jgi:hypothetical protein
VKRCLLQEEAGPRRAERDDQTLRMESNGVMTSTG